MEKIRLGISACLLGQKVRYDGGHKLDHFLKDGLSPYVEWLAVCPEVECGLPVPREAMQLVRADAGIRLVTIDSGIDHTDGLRQWCARRLQELEQEDLCGFVFKSRSPSCGVFDAELYDPFGRLPGTGPGIFSQAFMARFPTLAVEDETRLCDPALRKVFFERIFSRGSCGTRRDPGRLPLS